jgi:hypothetical protein
MNQKCPSDLCATHRVKFWVVLVLRCNKSIWKLQITVRPTTVTLEFGNAQLTPDTGAGHQKYPKKLSLDFGNSKDIRVIGRST